LCNSIEQKIIGFEEGQKLLEEMGEE